MTALLAVFGFLALVSVLAFTASVLVARGEVNGRVTRKELKSANRSLRDISHAIDKYGPMTDVVGQTMCDQIREALHRHRKDSDTP